MSAVDRSSGHPVPLITKPHAQRLDAKGNDSFSLLGFWRAHEAAVPAFAYVLRAVLANVPNSIPPERVFSILNNTFDDDQDRALADYIELSLQLQFNERSRSEGAAGVSLSVH